MGSRNTYDVTRQPVNQTNKQFWWPQSLFKTTSLLTDFTPINFLLARFLSFFFVVDRIFFSPFRQNIFVFFFHVIHERSDRCPRQSILLSPVSLFEMRSVIVIDQERNWEPIKAEDGNSYHADIDKFLFPFWESTFFCLELDSKWVHQDAWPSIRRRQRRRQKLILIAPIYHFFGFVFIWLTLAMHSKIVCSIFFRQRPSKRSQDTQGETFDGLSLLIPA